MSTPTELSISELRRKKRAGSEHSGHAHNGAFTPPHSSSSDEPVTGDHSSPDEDEIWARTKANEHSDRRAESDRPQLPYQAPPRKDNDDDGVKLPFDPVRALDALKRNWFWCLLAGTVFGALGLSYYFIGARSQLHVQLVRRETPALFKAGGEEGGSFQPAKYTDQALVNLIQSSDIVRRVVAKANKPITTIELAKSIALFPDHDTEMVTIAFKGKAKPQEAANLVNLFANEVVEFTKDLQTRDAKSVNSFLSDKIAVLNRELALVGEEMKKLPNESLTVDVDRQTGAYLTQLADLETKYELLKIDLEANNPINDKLQLARDELATLLLKYTDEHPKIQQQKDTIKMLETQAASAKANPGTGATKDDIRADNVHIVSSGLQKQSLSKQAEQTRLLIERTKEKLTGLPGKGLGDALVKNRYLSLDRIRTTLATRQRETELYQENALGYYAVLAPASAERVLTKGHVKKSLIFGILGAGFGIFLVAGFVIAREVLDDRLKTVADLERATELPVLGTLGDLNHMDEAAQRAWAFRTWTILKGKLSGSQSQGFVCGFTSAHHGEGRSTWIKLLVNTANERGLRVLTVASTPSTEPAVHPHEAAEEVAQQPKSAAEKAEQEEKISKALSSLSFPAQIAKQLSDPDAGPPIVHIPLPGWVWNIERRKQWQNALGHWKKIDNLVLLVELPPACEPESILLAEKLPQILWLCDSGKSTLKETREHMETFRHSGCNIVGAVLNRQPKSFWRNQMSRWFGMMVLLLGLSMATTQAQETTSTNEPASPVSTGSMTVKKAQRAAWQQRLTLGPGDIINLGFFGETNLTKNDVPIGPDGRISYLQATEIIAAGLTVDELRAALDKELAKFYRAPRSIVTPVSFRSKKYYVLGKVMNKGVFTLDRPITVLEALANAKGLETGIMNRNSIDLADLQRSFLIRQGKRVPIDFEKLFSQGDLSQNIPIEPDDFLYFPAMNLNEVYVVGEVRSPGVMNYTANASLIGALTDRGGFNERAYKSRVIVVRGSLSRPETFVVNVHDIVDGKMPDFRLQAKDIVYVSSRPFIKAEELLELAATGFIQSATTAWTGQYIGPFITKPFIKGIYNND